MPSLFLLPSGPDTRTHWQLVVRLEVRTKTYTLSCRIGALKFCLSPSFCFSILRCTSVCKGLRETYLSSSELQYIVKLGGQRLLPVGLGAYNYTPISERLRLLRDKAHAWFKFDTRPVQTAVVPETFVDAKHLSPMGTSALAMVTAQALPKYLQYCQKQNLVAAAYEIIDKSGAYIDLLALDGDGSHPRAVGPTLSTVPGFPGRQNIIQRCESWRLGGLERHIALWHLLLLRDPDGILWWLQIWDRLIRQRPILLIAGDNLKVYSIEDMSQAPQLLACFLLPFLVEAVKCFPSKDNIAHISQTGIQHTSWASDPSDRVLSLITASPLALFVIPLALFPSSTSSKKWQRQYLGRIGAL
ncbi:hypothetical protein DFJ58DRAFT_916733 [Suillus subalutaceus]|uniref:uncharacterized protein n=1 Tax=Suillus subalutaceus TaxID=48586 RepID=UPI001B8684E0|nr:uncharacterized protein DFJ58DRAFT_916733 [Suillus subalutaceus]KAG1840496.1 hypothetical protein DFJ58DRAFT_916733 [Suillus subalutaceus]